jgi:hypothetical protein
MKKVLCMMMVFVLACLAAACSSPAAKETPASESVQASETASAAETEAPESAADVIVFADPVLEERVRQQTGLLDGDITAAEAEEITSLDLDNKDNDPNASIKDLSGLEHFKNVKGLTISQNAISDLTPIAGMNLAVFYSMNGNNGITDFSPLANSTDMLDLTILGNENINDSNIGFIDGMTKMEMLWIQGAPELSDISAVANFQGVSRLIFVDCNISDVSPIAGLTNLKVLDLEGNPIEDYSPLADIYPNLEEKDFEME